LSPVYFEGQNVQEEEDEGHGEAGAEARGCSFGEKAPGASFVKVAFADFQFIEQTLDEWLILGVVRRTNSPYNSPIFCVPMKQGQGLRIVQDFWQLNQHSHIDKFSMKEINECIRDIGRANSSIFLTLDLTSGFWQMKLEPDSQPLTAFTIPNLGQFHWITSPMGLLGCPASFQRLML
jgi:hypothetical protein